MSEAGANFKSLKGEACNLSILVCPAHSGHSNNQFTFLFGVVNGAEITLTLHL